ncbi:MD-2-related lipid-recognition domain-containing protein [Mycena polygramma]|nr:MD-2-related lipid-recognition domain-containing protein [Mycena polygramma]
MLLPSLPSLLLASLLGGKAAATFAMNWSYKDCGLSSDPIQLKSINFSPGPPVLGKDLTIEVKAIVTQTIQNVDVNITIKQNDREVLQKTVDLCEAAKNANATVTCPVKKGVYTVQQTVTVPGQIPPGNYTVHLQGAKAVDNKAVFCLELDVSFK